MLKIHQELFILGIEAPDRIFKDFTNHYYNCTPDEYGYHHGFVINKIESEMELLNTIIENPNQLIVHHGIASFLRAILDTPLKAFIFELGVISHYIADLHQPFHTDGKNKFADEMTVHKVMEADIRKHLNDFKLQLKKRKRIEKPNEYFLEQIYYINKFYDNLIENYYLKKGMVKKNRWNDSSEIIQECLQLSAQNIANIYLNFEKSNSVFKTQIHHAKLQKKIGNFLDKKREYYLKKYLSGTVSIRKK